MNKLTVSIIAGAGISMLSSLTHAETFTANSSKSYVGSPQARVISSCMNAIEGYHAKEARLFLNRRGSFVTDNDIRSFVIQGWVWNNGERTKTTHECTVHGGGEGLAVTVSFAETQQIADR